MAGIRPRRRIPTTEPKMPKMVVVVEKTTRWHIMSKTDDGRLIEPVTREQYDYNDYNDSGAFDCDGYETFEKAEQAIVDFVSRRESSAHEYYHKTLYNGKTSGDTREFLLIPSCKVHVYRKEVVGPADYAND